MGFKYYWRRYEDSEDVSYQLPSFSSLNNDVAQNALNRVCFDNLMSLTKAFQNMSFSFQLLDYYNLTQKYTLPNSTTKLIKLLEIDEEILYGKSMTCKISSISFTFGDGERIDATTNWELRRILGLGGGSDGGGGFSGVPENFELWLLFADGFSGTDSLQNYQTHSISGNSKIYISDEYFQSSPSSLCFYTPTNDVKDRLYVRVEKDKLYKQHNIMINFWFKFEDDHYYDQFYIYLGRDESNWSSTDTTWPPYVEFAPDSSYDEIDVSFHTSEKIYDLDSVSLRYDWHNCQIYCWGDPLTYVKVIVDGGDIESDWMNADEVKGNTWVFWPFCGYDYSGGTHFYMDDLKIYKIIPIY